MISPSAPNVETVAGYRIDKAVVSGIRRASQETGVDFGYLMAQAAQESGFRSAARSVSSTATGLYQFIEGTWLQMMREHGGKYGHGELARQISPGAAGGFSVSDPAVRERILRLREDPTTAAALGAEFARTNKAQLEQALGRPVNSTDLYMAHFLGAGGATEFLKAIQSNGERSAAELLPKAAAANPDVFYAPGGRPRTVSEIHRAFADRIESRADVFAPLEQRPTAPSRAVAEAGAATAGGYRAAPDQAAAVPYGKPGLSLFSVVALSAYELVQSLRVPGDEDRPRRS